MWARLPSGSLGGTWHAHFTLTIAGHGHCCCLKNLSSLFPPCSQSASQPLLEIGCSLYMTAMNVLRSLALLQCNTLSFIAMTLPQHVNWTQFLNVRLVQEEENFPVNGIWEVISTVYFAEHWECWLGGNFYCELILWWGLFILLRKTT